MRSAPRDLADGGDRAPSSRAICLAVVVGASLRSMPSACEVQLFVAASGCRSGADAWQPCSLRHDGILRSVATHSVSMCVGANWLCAQCIKLHRRWRVRVVAILLGRTRRLAGSTGSSAIALSDRRPGDDERRDVHLVREAVAVAVSIAASPAIKPGRRRAWTLRRTGSS